MSDTSPCYNSIAKLEKIHSLVQSWVNKQGHDRCWYYPDIFRQIAAELDIKMEIDPKMPPRNEFEGGCVQYQEEEFGPKPME